MKKTGLAEVTMSIEKVRAFLESFGKADKIQEFDVSSATVELAAFAVGSSNSAVEMTPQELYDISGAKAWVKICDLPVSE